ncbi:hypothetical protein [Bacillus sp. FJAT-49736]|uniref:hypothetical protein n=1 Tax=Bacillus sp. FJAT-49736 TaxID=2833582 RepID=UPI001BC97CFB|nr:hypothetical protein [Bacillus sp. FJAT-49736]MBS4173512.1 hypothetical protein [Bacillus sp. FJAT-49736]
MNEEIKEIKANAKISYEDNGTYAKIHLSELEWLINQAEKVEYLENRKEEVLVESGKRWTKLLKIQEILNS